MKDQYERHIQKDTSKLSNQGTGSPESSGLVKEGTDLSRGPSVTGGESEDESVERLQVVRRDDRVLGLERATSVHLFKHFGRKSLGAGSKEMQHELVKPCVWSERQLDSHLKDLDLCTSLLKTGHDLFGQLGNVAVGRVVDDTDLGRHCVCVCM